jgi:putative oxidoreductase
MTHGWGKVQMVMAENFDKFPDPLNIGSKYSLICTALAEFVCAGLVAIGFLTRFAAIGPVIAMSVAAFIIHKNDPWFGAPPSKEPALLFLTGFLTLVFTGPGRFSIDGIMFGRRKPTI